MCLINLNFFLGPLSTAEYSESEWPIVFKEEVELSVRTEETNVRPVILQRRKKILKKRQQKNTTCPKCFKSYMYARNLRRHLKYECGLTPRFKCPYCLYCTKQSSPIYSHIRRQHYGQEVRYIDLKAWTLR